MKFSSIFFFRLSEELRVTLVICENRESLSIDDLGFFLHFHGRVSMYYKGFTFESVGDVFVIIINDFKSAQVFCLGEVNCSTC